MSDIVEVAEHLLDYIEEEGVTLEEALTRLERMANMLLDAESNEEPA
jgi:hypothetical protein